MAKALPAILASQEELREHSRAVVQAAVEQMPVAGVRCGDLRADVSASDVLTALGGIRLISHHEHNHGLGARVISLLLEGSATSPRSAPA